MAGRQNPIGGIWEGFLEEIVCYLGLNGQMGFLQEAGERGGPIGILFLNTFIAQFHL